MPRYEIPGDPISVAFGYDFPIPGIFLSVFDKRLKYDPDATAKVNAVTETIGVKDGGGSYFDLHTGIGGFGVKVDDETMKTYLKRYGVTNDQISQLPFRSPPPPKTPATRSAGIHWCSACHGSTSSACMKCRVARYCCKSHQRMDWPIHKIFCQISSLPSQVNVPNGILAILLPERSEEPVFVQLPQQWREDEDGGYWVLDKSEFIAGTKGLIRSDFYPNQNLEVPFAIHLLFKDDFLVDGVSRENLCIQRIMNKRGIQNNTHWKNNVLIVKASKREPPEFDDMTVADASVAVDFLVDYTVSSHSV